MTAVSHRGGEDSGQALILTVAAVSQPHLEDPAEQNVL